MSRGFFLNNPAISRKFRLRAMRFPFPRARPFNLYECCPSSFLFDRNNQAFPGQSGIGRVRAESATGRPDPVGKYGNNFRIDRGTFSSMKSIFKTWILFCGKANSVPA
jgi:hypothetical protein